MSGLPEPPRRFTAGSTQETTRAGSSFIAKARVWREARIRTASRRSLWLNRAVYAKAAAVDWPGSALIVGGAAFLTSYWWTCTSHSAVRGLYDFAEIAARCRHPIDNCVQGKSR